MHNQHETTTELHSILENQAASCAPDPSTSGQARIAAKLQEIDEQCADLRDSVRTSVAESEYARRRAEADLAHAHRFAIEELAKALLPFKDSLETAMLVDTSDAGAMKDGLELALKLLQSALSKNGLTEIAAQPGDAFDPHMHRLLVQGEDNNTSAVIESFEQKGYVLNGRVIRPAVVTIVPAK